MNNEYEQKGEKFSLEEQTNQNVAQTYSTEILSSIIDLICEKNHERLQNGSNDEIAILKEVVEPLFEKIASLNHSLAVRNESLNKVKTPNDIENEKKGSDEESTKISMTNNPRSAESNGNASIESSTRGEIGPLHIGQGVTRLSLPAIPNRRRSEVSVPGQSKEY